MVFIFEVLYIVIRGKAHQGQCSTMSHGSQFIDSDHVILKQSEHFSIAMLFTKTRVT